MTAYNNDLLHPMLAMFLWTFLVALRNVQVRVRAVLKGDFTNQYFELFQGAQPNDTVLKNDAAFVLHRIACSHGHG